MLLKGKKFPCIFSFLVATTDDEALIAGYGSNGSLIPQVNSIQPPFPPSQDIYFARVKVNPMFTTGFITSGQITTNEVTTNEVTTNVVTSSQVTTGRLTSSSITSGSLTTSLSSQTATTASGNFVSNHVTFEDVQSSPSSRNG